MYRSSGKVVLACLTFLACITSASQAADEKRQIDLISERIGVLGIPLEENDKPTFRILLNGEVGVKGEGRGTLVLDLSEPPLYDELGFVASNPKQREMKLECSIKLLKKVTRVYSVREGGPGSDKYRQETETWNLYSITGPMVISRLFLAMPESGQWPRGRILVQDREGKVKHVVEMSLPPQPEPCHPGCFPAGTVVLMPTGETKIERVREGDVVTTVGVDGQRSTAKVHAVFKTTNRLLEVRTSEGKLLTTVTQPLALESGGYRAAGELKPGDRLWYWKAGVRNVVVVQEVTAPLQSSEVFNLILGTPTTFIANNFLARSKPPTETVQP